MTFQELECSGQLDKKSTARAAVEVDCSHWQAEPSSEPWTTGSFVKSSMVRPAAEVDCSSWQGGVSLCLELTLRPERMADSVSVAFCLLDVLAAIDKLDRALGGAGLTRLSGEQSNGTVTISLAPEQHIGAAERLSQICDHLNGATHTTTALPLPAAVKTLVARVA